MGAAGAIVGAAAGSGNYFDPVSSSWNWMANNWARNDQNWENQKAMDKQNQWTAGMANTAHQREVQDLVAAGLNPILSSGGNGAPSPSSASPGTMMGQPALQFPASHAVPGLGDIINNSRKLDIESAKATAEISKLQAEVPKIQSDKNLKDAQTRLQGKGTIRADLEQKAAGALDDGLGWIQKTMQKMFTRPEGFDPNKHFGPDWMYAHPTVGPTN